MSSCGRALSLAAALLTAACGPEMLVPTDEPDARPGGADGAPGQPDGAPGQPDGAPGQPDGAPRQPDAAPGQPDAAPGQPDAAPGGEVLACDVTFAYPAGAATSVDLRGDFTPGGWGSGAPMSRVGDEFQAAVSLAHGQRIHYKFVVDGTTWVNDPANPDTVPDDYGGSNSVLTVDCGGTPAPAFDWRDAVMYFVLVDRFANGDPGNDAPVADVETAANYAGGDLAGVLQKIQEGYFAELGVNTLWLTAPVDNTGWRGIGTDGHWYSGYHGYWPSDLEDVDEHVGDLGLLRQVVAAAHGAGLRVVLDYVMNHVHEESPVYAAHPDWFWPQNGCICGEGCSWDSEPDRLRCWFRSYLPDFNFQVPAARAFSVENAVEWVKGTGIDGLRLDAVKHIETSWVTDLRGRLRGEVEWGGRVFYLVGETYTSDRNLLKAYVDPATMLDGQFDFPLRAVVVRTILMRQGGMGDVSSFLDGNDGFYGPGAVMGTFLGNHDLPRSIHFAEDWPMWSNEWDSGRDRSWSGTPALPSSPNPYERVAVAMALLMTMPGMPLVYYGDEIGLPGAGDPDNRRPMQWTGLTSNQSWLKGRIGRLTRIRAAHPALRRGTRHTLGVTNDVLVYEMTTGGDHVWVALNRGDGSAPAQGLPAGSYRDLVADAAVTAPFNLPPRSAAILVTP